jgi:hypothetical protein
VAKKPNPFLKGKGKAPPFGKKGKEEMPDDKKKAKGKKKPY